MECDRSLSRKKWITHLLGGPVSEEMAFEASQHLDSVRDKFYLHDFSPIGNKLLEMGKQLSSALSKLLLKPADIPGLIEDLPDEISVATGKKMRRRKQMKSSATKTTLESNRAKMMTGTRTSYSPTSSSRASKNGRCSAVTFPTVILSTIMMWRAGERALQIRFGISY
jgi:hypothetical protein